MHIIMQKQNILLGIQSHLCQLGLVEETAEQPGASDLSTTSQIRQADRYTIYEYATHRQTRFTD